MEPKNDTSIEKTVEAKTAVNACTDKSCASGGGCGGPGLCPGVAILLAYLLGMGITFLSGLQWLGWVVGISVGLILITGAWRFLPKSDKSHAS
ncbi:MAG: hypothetical protein ACNA77_09680 [Opitutales bacterium]